MLDKFLGREPERRAREANDWETVALIRKWRRGRLLAVVGVVVSIAIIVLSLGQLLGLIAQPTPMWFLICNIVFCTYAMVVSFFVCRHL